MSGFLLYALATLCAFRLTRLVTTDTLFDAPRNWLVKQTPQGPERSKLDEFITCPWCAGAHISAAIVAGVCLLELGSMPIPLMWWAAISGGVGLLATVEDALG